MGPNSQEIPDLVTFTEEILNGKLHFYAVWIEEILDLSKQAVSFSVSARDVI